MASNRAGIRQQYHLLWDEVGVVQLYILINTDSNSFSASRQNQSQVKRKVAAQQRRTRRRPQSIA